MSAGHALTHIHILLFTALVEPMRASFGLDEAELLGAASLSGVLFGLGAVPAGFLSDRFGEKPLLVAFFILTALGSGLVGFANGEALLWGGMAVLGAGTSIYHPVGLAFLSKTSIDPGRAMGINGFWGSIGTALSPILAVEIAYIAGLLGIVSTDESWRASYAVLAVLTVFPGVSLARARITAQNGARVDRHASRRSYVASATHGGGARATQHGHGAPDSSRARGAVEENGSLGILRLSLLLGAMLCGGVYFHLVSSVLPTHLGTEGFALGASSTLLAGGWLAGAVYSFGGAGQILSGRLLRHREGRGLYVLILLVATPLVFAAGAFSGTLLVVMASLMAVVIFMVQPVENVLLARYSSARLRGILFGAKFVLVFGVGGLGTALGGWIMKRYGTSVAFTVASGFTFVAFLFAFGAWASGFPASSRSRTRVSKGVSGETV